jgi:hypothetical protein
LKGLSKNCVNCSKELRIHYEIRKIEGTPKKYCKLWENVNYGNLKAVFCCTFSEPIIFAGDSSVMMWVTILMICV